jgi:excisionase family DNA binding protein
MHQHPDDNAQVYISKWEVARRLSVSTRTIEREVSKGLPHVRVGGQLRFLWEAVAQWYDLPQAELRR